MAKMEKGCKNESTNLVVRFPNCHECPSSSSSKWVVEPDYKFSGRSYESQTKKFMVMVSDEQVEVCKVQGAQYNPLSAFCLNYRLSDYEQMCLAFETYKM